MLPEQCGQAVKSKLLEKNTEFALLASEHCLSWLVQQTSDISLIPSLYLIKPVSLTQRTVNTGWRSRGQNLQIILYTQAQMFTEKLAVVYQALGCAYFMNIK